VNRDAQKHSAAGLPQVQKAHAISASQNWRSQIPVPRLPQYRSAAVAGSGQTPCWRIAAYGERLVPEYRAYTVGDDGHFEGFEPFSCYNDNEATAKACSLLHGKDIELWSGPRLVIHLTARKKPGAISHEIKSGRMVPKD
jgi:hypothetical protein